MENFTIDRKFGIFVKICNTQCTAGLIHLFHYKGPVVLTFYQEALHTGWAIRTIFTCYLFSIIHIGKGKSERQAGFYINWGSIQIRKIHRGYQCMIRSADTMDVYPKRPNQKKATFHVIKR